MTTPIADAAAASAESDARWHGIPPAARPARPRWRDLRLILGLALVIGSMALGATVVGGSDSRTGLWAATAALVPGVPLTAADLQMLQVGLTEGAGSYVTGPAPVGYVPTRPVGPGELIPVGALQPPDQVADDVRLVSVSVPRTSLPADIRRGDLVDVWTLPESGEEGRRASLLLERVPVAALPDTSGAFGTEGSAQPVVLAVGSGAGSVSVIDDADADGVDDAVAVDAVDDVVAELLAAAADDAVVLALVVGAGEE